jgi:hypothetical protein
MLISIHNKRPFFQSLSLLENLSDDFGGKYFAFDVFGNFKIKGVEL